MSDLSPKYYPNACEVCHKVVCTCDEWSPCIGCGKDVISEVGATKYVSGWCHNACDIGASNARSDAYWRRVGGHD